MGPASCLRPRAPRYAPSRFKVDALAGFVHAHAPSWYPKDTDPTEKSHLYEAEAAVLVCSEGSCCKPKKCILRYFFKISRVGYTLIWSFPD